MKKNPFNIFNVNEFKKWMENSNATPENDPGQNTVGLSVTSRVSFKKLKSVSEILDNERAIVEFHKKGGIVLEEEDNLLTIKTDKGSIKIHKNYTII